MKKEEKKYQFHQKNFKIKKKLFFTLFRFQNSQSGDQFFWEMCCRFLLQNFGNLNFILVLIPKVRIRLGYFPFQGPSAGNLVFIPVPNPKNWEYALPYVISNHKCAKGTPAHAWIKHHIHFCSFEIINILLTPMCSVIFCNQMLQKKISHPGQVLSDSFLCSPLNVKPADRERR